MKIKNIECWSVQMRLTEPYTIAYETIDSCTNVFVRAETDTGLTGFGCAAPDLAVTGESAETVMQVYGSIIEPLLRGADPLHRAKTIELLLEQARGHPSAIAMADMVLHDLVGKAAGLPLYQILGGFRDSMPTSITIGILNTAETIDRARRFVSDGFRILKIKGGADVDVDIKRIIELREVLGADIELRFDANQGYTPAQAMRFVSETRQSRVEILEQPTPRDQLEQLGIVSRSVSVPVMADESVSSEADAFHLATEGLADMVNIKLQKIGGLHEAARVNAIAHAAGYEAMVGCMDESALSIAAGLHFALARPNVLYADLDGHLDLIDDPFAGAVVLKDGVLYPSEKPGLGAGFPS
ncbi:MAG: dipeptide epimerase [Rhodothermales bacterium]|nr:dipeptide epimerase [Rhodothermales bacterium]